MKGFEQRRIQHRIGTKVDRGQVLVDWSLEGHGGLNSCRRPQRYYVYSLSRNQDPALMAMLLFVIQLQRVGYDLTTEQQQQIVSWLLFVSAFLPFLDQHLFESAFWNSEKVREAEWSLFPVNMKHACMLSHVWLLETPCTVPHQAPPSMGFSRQNTGVGYQFLLQRIFHTQGSNPCILWLLHWQADSTTEPPGRPHKQETGTGGGTRKGFVPGSPAGSCSVSLRFDYSLSPLNSPCQSINLSEYVCNSYGCISYFL